MSWRWRRGRSRVKAKSASNPEREMTVHKHPIEHWVAKLERGEPFSFLTYGDGEFMVASGRCVGETITNAREVVTQQLCDEMRASFDWNLTPWDKEDNEIVRGSDPNIIDPNEYKGQDIDSVRACHEHALEWIERVPEWVDGCVWDVAAREGRLGPLIGALRRRPIVLVSSAEVADTNVLRQQFCLTVPSQGAAEWLMKPSDKLIHDGALTNLGTVVVCCCGLSAIPLIMRLRRRCPSATYLDLGSALDVFARTGGERGWRGELYADEARWRECVRKNLEGVK